jgi:hypothetical protein
MLEITNIIISIFIGFIGSRCAVMSFDFMCYGGILWKLKYRIAKIEGLQVPDMTNLSISDGHQKLQEFYDYASGQSFWIALLDCKYCMTVWFSLIFGLISLIYLPFYTVPLAVIFGYLITEKL